jgi:hypothetical protein
MNELHIERQLLNTVNPLQFLIDHCDEFTCVLFGWQAHMVCSFLRKGKKLSFYRGSGLTLIVIVLFYILSWEKLLCIRCIPNLIRIFAVCISESIYRLSKEAFEALFLLFFPILACIVFYSLFHCRFFSRELLHGSIPKLTWQKNKDFLNGKRLKDHPLRGLLGYAWLE